MKLVGEIVLWTRDTDQQMWNSWSMTVLHVVIWLSTNFKHSRAYRHGVTLLAFEQQIYKLFLNATHLIRTQKSGP